MVLLFRRKDLEDDDDELLKPALPVAEGNEDEVDLSQPPATGEEFLRLVRMEAAKLSNVVRKDVPQDKIQRATVRVAEEEILATPPVFLPKRSWVNDFLAFFTEKRLSLARERIQKAKQIKSLPRSFPPRKDNEAWRKIFTSTFPPPSLVFLFQLDTRGTNDLLSLAMEEETEADEKTNTFPFPNQAKWIFALMTVVDKPLPPDLAAEIRSFFKKCYNARAKLPLSANQSETLAILNILIVLSGNFFGQASPDYVIDFDDGQEGEEEEEEEGGEGEEFGAGYDDDDDGGDGVFVEEDL